MTRAALEKPLQPPSLLPGSLQDDKCEVVECNSDDFAAVDICCFNPAV